MCLCMCVQREILENNDLTAEQTDALICFLLHLNSDKKPLLSGNYVTISLSPLDFTHIPKTQLTPESMEQDVENTSTINLS